MKQYILRLLSKTIQFLQSYYLKYASTANDNQKSFHSLSPIDNAEGNEYNDALLWALRNRKNEDIKNLALTGPYGSGKSSILKTFQKEYKNEFSFLNISLATFKEELTIAAEQSEGEGKSQDKDLLRLIELSILQQIFYHEEDKAIPDSRFKKIRSFKKSNLIFIATSVLVLVICCFNLFAPDKFKSVFHLSLSKNTDLVVHLLSLALFLAGVYIILLRSVRLINSIKISKFKFNDAEIEIDKGISKSILNNHLDEILYFFEVTPYSVVIIEDLDRFQQTEIFTKLRELNLLINNSKKVKRDIVFLYAVRDDMFQDKDRTKFFDFIVPVIPVINSSNSNEQLLSVINSNDYHISDDLIDNLSLFIDDMRLLYNITNEYFIYHSKLDKKLDQDKLLSIIVYKNIHPNDFVNLSNGTGILFDVLDSKEVFIKNMLAEIDEKITAAKVEIAMFDQLQIKNIKELRRLYILEYVSRLDLITSFRVNNNIVTYEQVLEDNNFDYLKKNNAQYSFMVQQYSNSYTRSYAVIPQKFAEIEKSIDSQFTYAQREAQIKAWTANKAEILKEKVSTLEKQKITTRHFKFKDVIAEGNAKIELENEKQNLLINILLRNGYIDEDYLDYISIFYEGSITKEDRQFLLNVKSQVAMDFDFKLRKIDKLVAKINIVEFGRSHLLNYNLLDYLLKAPAHVSKLSSLTGILADKSQRSISFIDSFIDNGVNIPELIFHLTQKWSSFWKFIDTQSNYIQDRKLKYFKLIMNYAEIKDILSNATNSGLVSFIINQPDFLQIFEEKDKAKQVISELKIKFTNLELSGGDTELIDFIYEGDFYAVSLVMVRKILEAQQVYSESDFATRNYFAIQHSGLDKMMTYLGNNVDLYVADIYLKLENNVEDPEELLIDLLNNEAISMDNRAQIIERSSVRIQDITTINDTAIHVLLLKHSKLKAVWENLITYYHNNDDIFDDTIVGFMESNVDELSLLKVNKEVEPDELLTVDAFLKMMVTENQLSDSAYGKLIRSDPYAYGSLEFEGLTAAKVLYLIDTFTLGITAKNFNYLKTHYPGMQIKLLEANMDAFVKKIETFELDASDLLRLYNSAAFTVEKKKILYENTTSDIITGNSKLSDKLGQLLIENPGWDVTKDILKHLLTSNMAADNRIQLFNTRFQTLDKGSVTEMIKKLPHPFSDIATLGKRPLIPHGVENGFFANNLKSLNYISKLEHERRGIRISTFKK